MEKSDFVKQYILTFCATWQAKNHAEYCSRDKHEALENPPLEDAKFLGEQLWEKLQEEMSEDPT